MLLTERYSEKIAGVISCYDRVVIQGTLPGWCFDGGMTAFLNANKIRIFDYPQFANALREDIRFHAEAIAAENNLEIEFIRKINAFRKDDRIKKILAERGTEPGLVHIFSAMEKCTSYKPWHDKTTGKTSLKYDSGKCLHYYFYFIDKEYGLCYLRVPTWCPFRLQFYFNGHNLLATKLSRQGISYELRENAFLKIDNWEQAQSLSDSIRVEDLHQALDILASRYVPFLQRYGLSYRWSIMQAEYATDIVFKKQADLGPLYETLVRTAVHSVKPENIASFLGQKLHWNYQGEMGNNFNTRILGTRIKHQMGEVSIKMYDKFGIVLRIETTTNDVSQFRHYREVQHFDGSKESKVAPMKKNIYSLYILAQLLKESNRRYLEFISTFDDPSDGIKKLAKISDSVKEDDRSYKGFNFFSQADQKLFEVLARGEFNIRGFQNKMVRKFIPDLSPATVSRILKRLLLHGLIKKVARTHKYYLTKLGKAVITTGLKTRALFIIPSLAGIEVSAT
ncbi:MAG: MarR family transcriptional regulator [Bacillota bacterium]